MWLLLLPLKLRYVLPYGSCHAPKAAAFHSISELLRLAVDARTI